MKLSSGRIVIVFPCLVFVFIVGVYYELTRPRIPALQCSSAKQPRPLALGDGASVDAVAATEVQSLLMIVNKLPETPVDHSLLLKHGYVLLPIAAPELHIAPDMPATVAETLFYQYIRTPSIICPKKVRIGRSGDGGWDACVAGPMRIEKPCLVYSFGIGPDSTFDNTMADVYRCLNMAFDPSIGKKDYKPKELFWFFNIGIGGNNEMNKKNWRIQTFGSILKDNGHENRTIDILKIDTEYAEWESFEAMFQDGSLRRVKQLMFEFHTKELGMIDCVTSPKDFAYYWQILRGLDKLGFKMWNYFPNHSGVYKSKHTNADLPCCGNVYYININYIV